MHIKYKASNEQFQFINIGDCFKYCDELYIKIRSSSSDDNSFNLNRCKVETLYQNTKVTSINMVLVEE